MCIRDRDLYALWTHGRPKVNPLDDTGNYRELAEYLIKETSKTFAEAAGPYKKRWNQSKNLRKPKIKIEVVPVAYTHLRILSVTPMGNDCLLAIAFEQAGTKKIMANFARLKPLAE